MNKHEQTLEKLKAELEAVGFDPLTIWTIITIIFQVISFCLKKNDKVHFGMGSKYLFHRRFKKAGINDPDAVEKIEKAYNLASATEMEEVTDCCRYFMDNEIND